MVFVKLKKKKKSCLYYYARNKIAQERIKQTSIYSMHDEDCAEKGLAVIPGWKH